MPSDILNDTIVTKGKYIYNSFLVIIYSGKCRGELITYVRSLLNIFPLLNFSCNV